MRTEGGATRDPRWKIGVFMRMYGYNIPIASTSVTVMC